MKKTKLGEFEEFVLLTVSVLQERDYGVAIRNELESALKQKLSVGSVQSALSRLHDKGFLNFEFSEATPIKGGKRKKIYSTTRNAQQVLKELMELRNRFWKVINEVN